MRLPRLLAASAAAVLLSLGTLTAPAQAAIPYGYTLQDAAVGVDAFCHAHFKTDWHNHVSYRQTFFWVRAILVNDVVFAEGDFCQIGNQIFGQTGNYLKLRTSSNSLRWCMCWRGSGYSSEYSIFQGFDGNLVSYDWSGTAVGASDTCCISGSYHPYLAIQSDGNVVVYKYKPVDNTYQAMWASNTAT